MTRAVVIFGFLLAFSAGLMVGLTRRPGTPAPATPEAGGTAPTSRPAGRSGWLTAELGLSSEQRERLDKIWSETARRGRGEQDERRRQYRKERDEKIAALLQGTDQAAYDAIQKEYADRNAAMEADWRKGYEDAVARTKEILTADQRAKYEDLLKRHGGTRDSHGNRRPEERATSRPTPDK